MAGAAADSSSPRRSWQRFTTAWQRSFASNRWENTARSRLRFAAVLSRAEAAQMQDPIIDDERGTDEAVAGEAHVVSKTDRRHTPLRRGR